MEGRLSGVSVDCRRWERVPAVKGNIDSGGFIMFVWRGGGIVRTKCVLTVGLDASRYTKNAHEWEGI